MTEYTSSSEGLCEALRLARCIDAEGFRLLVCMSEHPHGGIFQADVQYLCDRYNISKRQLVFAVDGLWERQVVIQIAGKIVQWEPLTGGCPNAQL